jgi:hypothetical protein
VVSFGTTSVSDGSPSYRMRFDKDLLARHGNDCSLAVDRKLYQLVKSKSGLFDVESLVFTVVDKYEQVSRFGVRRGAAQEASRPATTCRPMIGQVYCGRYVLLTATKAMLRVTCTI